MYSDSEALQSNMPHSTISGPEMPSLEALGRDLLEVSTWRKVLSLVSPFVWTVLFFVFAAHRWWVAAVLCPVALSFLTYGSTSHDLVHRNLRLPGWLNEGLLTAVELLAFRSGHAYRVVHMNHHALFPDGVDLEGAAAAMPLWRALLDGPTLQYRLWWFALHRPGLHRRWVVAEGSAALLLLAASAAAWHWTHLPAIYAALMVAGSWVYPLSTAFFVHDPHAADALHQTRLFRGRVLEVLALEHLFHLEHHLYPQVPHQNWPRLAKRLDPYFERAGLEPFRLWF